MTAPAIDGRTWIERARELAKRSPFEIHEEPSRALDAIRAILPVVEAALRWAADPAKGQPDLIAAVELLSLRDFASADLATRQSMLDAIIKAAR